MAPFNPQIQPTNDPYYVRLHTESVNPRQPIEPQGVQPTSIKPTGVTQADQSGEYLGKAIGAGIAGLAQEIDFAGKAADTVIKQDIDQRLFQAIDAERLRYTGSLENALSPQSAPVAGSAVQPNVSDVTTQQIGNIVANVNAPNLTNVTTQVPAGAPGGTGAPAEMPPATLQTELPQQLNTLSDAMANGKISPTFYYGRLNEIAKQFRAQNPGFRDYIDQQIHQITGVTPANAYITSLTQRINTAITNTQSEREKVLSVLRRDDVLATDPSLAVLYSQGKITADQAIMQAGKNLSIKHNLEMVRLANQTSKESDEYKEYTRGKNFDKLSVDITNAAFSGITLSTDQGTPQSMLEYIQDVNTGKAPRPSHERLLAINELLQGRRAQTRAQWAQAAQAAGYTDPEAIKKKVDALDAITFGPVDDFLAKGDYSAANHTVNMTKAITNDQITGLFGNDKFGAIQKNLVMGAIFKQFGAEQYLASLGTSIGLTQGLNEQVKAYMQNGLMRMGSQPDAAATGQNFTLRQFYDDAIAKGVGKPQLLKKVLDEVDSIGIKGDQAPTDEVKKNYIKAYFGQGILDMNWRDRNGQDMSPAIFRQMTAERIRDEVFRLGKEDPTLIDTYKNWVDQSWKILFTKDINALKDVQANPGMSLRWESDPGKGVHQWHLFQNGRDITTTPLTPTVRGGIVRDVPTPELQEAQRVVNRLNSAMQPVIGVANKVPGFDVDYYLLNSFIQAGFDPTKAGGDIPSKMVQAVVNARQTQEDRNKRYGIKE